MCKKYSKVGSFCVDFSPNIGKWWSPIKDLLRMNVSFVYKVSFGAMALLLGKSLYDPLSQMT
jgi:hypothetical protein